MKSRHFISIHDTPVEDLLEVFDVCRRQKETLAREGRLRPILAGRALGMLFEKPSLRTRVSFEVAMAQLGGHATTLGHGEAQLGDRETIRDFARVLSRYVDVIAARVFKHAHVVEMAANSSAPVINALSDYSHPCQALADLWTIRERLGRWKGARVVFVGDGNNVARSLGFLCAKLGVAFALAAPEGYRFDKRYLRKIERIGPKARFEMGTDPLKLARGADVIYTDVWVSMGQEAEQEARRRALAAYQVNSRLLRRAGRDAIVLHCLPAHRGEEISDEVMDGPQSAVYDQAENRMHTARALLTCLLAGGAA